MKANTHWRLVLALIASTLWGQQALAQMPPATGTAPHYFSVPNYANSPLPKVGKGQINYGRGEQGHGLREEQPSHNGNSQGLPQFRASANTNPARISSWRNSSKFRLRRCQGAFASRSRRSCCHKKVLDTCTSRRRRRAYVGHGCSSGNTS